MHRILFLLAFLLTSPLLGEAFLFVGYNDQPCSYASSRGVTITYNHLDLPVTISWNGQGQQRLEMTYDANGTLLTRESFNSGGTAVEKRDYVGGIEYVDGVLESVAHQEGRVFYGTGSERWDYALTDHLGNTRLLYSDLNGDGIPQVPSEIVQEAHYLPFGLEMTGPWMGAGVADDTKYGYNGIEKVDDFDLNVNMAFYRTLDPVIGRWWQVDPKAESFGDLSPYNSMGNSPMVNVDPDGDFFFGTLTAPLAGFVRGVRNLAGGEGLGGFVQGFGEGLSNGVKIDAGNFAWDRNLNPLENVGVIISRFSWQMPQQLVGNIYNAAHNMSGQVDWVRYQNGATVISSGMQPGGISLGSYITGGSGNIEADPFNRLFQHEYGHYLQSIAMGPAYLWRIGIPSIQSASSNTSPYGGHSFHPVEQDANRRAFNYFNREVDGFYGATAGTSGWNFFRNPLDPGGTATRSLFFDFRNAADMRRLEGLRVRARWTDYVFGPFAGVANAISYNNP